MIIKSLNSNLGGEFCGKIQTRTSTFKRANREYGQKMRLPKEVEASPFASHLAVSVTLGVHFLHVSLK